MTTILKNKIQTARKDYYCDGSYWIVESEIMKFPDDFKVSFANKRKLVKIRQEKFKISKGTKYLYQVGIQDGFYTSKFRQDCFEICCKYELFYE